MQEITTVLTVTKVSYSRKNKTKRVDLVTNKGKTVVLKDLNRDEYGSLLFEGIAKGQKYGLLPNSNLVIYSFEHTPGTISANGRDLEYCGLRVLA